MTKQIINYWFFCKITIEDKNYGNQKDLIQRAQMNVIQKYLISSSINVEGIYVALFSQIILGVSLVKIQFIIN